MEDNDLYEKLENNVNDIFIEYYPSLSNNLKKSVIKFIRDNYHPNIARDQRYLPTAVNVACCYLNNKPVMLRELLPLYFYLNDDATIDLLHDKYYECRKLIIDNPRIINLVFGTKLTKETPRNVLFNIHEKIKKLDNSLMVERMGKVLEKIRETMQTNTNSKSSIDINKLEKLIKRIILAFGTINAIESKETKKIKKLVLTINREFYGYVPDNYLAKTHNGKK